MNSAVKQLPRSIAKAVGRWAALISVLLAVPALGQGFKVAGSGPITINDAAFELGAHVPKAATPYPGVVGISNLLGNLQRVTVTLENVNHPYAADLDVLLVRVEDNKKVVLLSDVAVNFPLSGVTLTLDDSVTGSLPVSAAVPTGSYKPTNINPAGDTADDFVVGAGGPSGPYSDTLAGLAGSEVSPNGTYRLFVVDDKNTDSGTIGAWSVNVWTTPVVDQLSTNRVVGKEDTEMSLTFRVRDSDTSVNSLTYSVASSDESLVKPSAVAFSGTGETRTLKFTPEANKTGTANITIKVKDQITEVTQTFQVVVEAVNDAPTIVLNQGTVSTTAGALTTNTLSAVIKDADPTDTLRLLSISSDTNVVADGQVFFTAGSNGTNSFTIAPRGGATGRATVQVGVTDGTVTNFASIVVTVDPVKHYVFGTGAAIGIPESGIASNAYPQTLTISNVVGLIGKARITLADVNHANPDDLDVLLVSPAGAKIALMGQAGGTTAISNGRLTFDATASSAIPDSTAITTGTYRPADYATGDLTAPAPAGPYSTDLNALQGTSANGVWSLYVVDRTASNAGNITGGFVVEIFPAPTINGLATVTTPEDTPITIAFSVADVDGAVTNVVVPGIPGFVTTAVNLSGTNVSLTLTPVANVANTNNVSVIVKDNSGGYTTTGTFSLRITAVNDAPTIASIGKQITYAGVPITGVRGSIGDVETAPASLTVSATSSNTKLVPNGNIIVTRDPADTTGASLLIDLYPLGTQAGTAIVTVTVSDGAASTTTSFEVEVLGPPSPLFANANTILIGDTGGSGGVTNSSPNPANIAVSGIGSAIIRAEVTLSGLTHPTPQDLDILLVGPGGQKIMLMSDAGGNNAIRNAQLIFSSSSTVTTTLPAGGQIVSGIYAQSDINDGADTILGVSSPYTGTLASLVGTNPNGTWSLYINDDTGNSKGPNGSLLEGGWMINFVTQPQISNIADTSTPEDTEKRVAFTIGDDQPGVPVTLTASSSNPSVVANTGLSFEGSGANRTLKIVPVANASGTSTITVQVTILGSTSTDTFVLTVTAVDDQPTISEVANQTKAAGLIVGPLTVTLADQETADAGTIELTATSSDTALVPNSNIVITGTGASRNILILPNGNTAGETIITLTAKDSTNQKGTRQFKVTYSRSLSFANTSPITIRDNASAAPYPSIIGVSGVNGLVSNVRVTLLGLTHAFPDDVALLLVSPQNDKKVVLMANAGGGAPTNSLTGVTLVFDDAGTALPDEGKIISGTYAAGNYGISTSNGDLPSPAPTKPYASALSTFAGISPNGDWKLYVLDDTFSDSGAINGGWILSFQTAPSIATIPNQTMPEDTVLGIPITLEDADTVATDLRVTTLISNGDAFVTNITVLPTNQFARTLSIYPRTDTSGTNFIDVSVTDGTTTTTTRFNLTISAVDDAPTITTSTNLVRIKEDTTTNIVFTVKDVDSVLAKTNITVASGNTTLLPQKSPDNISVAGADTIAAGSNGDFTVTVTPAANQNGEGTVNFSIKDGTTTSGISVILAVDPVNDIPTITGLPASTNLFAGGVLSNIPFTVGDIETGAKNIAVTASSSNTGLIPNANIVLGGANESRLLTVSSVGTGTGFSDITIRAVDENSGTNSVVIRVNVDASPGQTFANTAGITIRDNNTATGSPSTIPVSGLVGAIHSIAVTLDGVTHTAPDDIDVLLVSPTGKKVKIMSDAGGRIAVSNTRITFDSTKSNTIPDDGPIAEGAGVYAASDFNPDEVFSGIAAPYTDRLSDLVGTVPNGTWTLYVQDDTANDSGSIASGWSIKIVTAPTISSTAPTQLVQNEDTADTFNLEIRDADNADTSTPDSNYTISVTSANTSLQPVAGVTRSKLSGNMDAGSIFLVTVLPATNAPSDSLLTTNTITLTVTRNGDGARASTTVTQVVVPVNDAPTISRITEKTTEEDRSITVDFLISDVDSLSRQLSVAASSSNPTLIDGDGLKLYGAGNSVASLPSNEATITLTPKLDQIGEATITLTVQDKRDTNAVLTTVSTFLFKVVDLNDPPTLGAIADFSITAGGTDSKNVLVLDPEGSNVRLSATSSDERLVRASKVTFSLNDSPGTAVNSNRVVTVTTETGVRGTATITVTATDGQRSIPTTFLVNVVESRERAYANNTSFTISDNGPSAVYPSIIDVSGLVGNVTGVRVGLNGLAHRFPQDIDILLVSPNGKKVLLMSDVGGGNSVTNINLELKDGTAEFISAGSLASGTFKPTNAEGVNDPFASPAPAGPYDTTFAAFNGGNPNGEWKLYIMDDTPSDSGFLTGGWNLYITTEPKIEGFSNVTVEEDTDFRVAFGIVEESFAAGGFTFRTTSTNSAVVRTNDLVISGSEGSYTVRGTPVANASGETEITVFAKNTYGQEVSGKFKVIVTAVNDVPTITDVADLTTTAGQQTNPVDFNASDVETEKKNLVIAISSSNTRLIPPSNVFIVGNTLTVAPVGSLSGLADITIKVTDGNGASAETTFAVLVVPAPNPQYANSDSITIRDNAVAGTYPSTIEISGVRGNVARVTVAIAQLNHPYPADLDILVVGPLGQKVVLMSDAAGSGSLVNARLTFDDRASAQIPFNPAEPIANGSYKPTNHQGTDTFPAPAPAGPYSADLSAFAGTDPNGVWSLYILDDAAPDSGSLQGGWVLNIFTTDPTITTITDQVTDENVTKTVAFRVDDADTAATSLVTTATTDKSDLISLSITGTGNDRSLVITPVAFASGEANVTVTVDDGSRQASTSFKVTVNAVNQAPELAGLGDRATPANVVLNARFTVFDRDTALSNVVVGATSSTPSLGTVEVLGDSADRTLVFRPSGNQGQTIITVIANDGSLSTTNNFALTVTAPYVISISEIADQSIDEGGVLNIPFTVSGSTAGNLGVVGVSSNTGLIDRVEISGSGTSFIATLRARARTTGSTTITLTATDDLGSGTASFEVTVLPLNEPVISAIPDQRTPKNVPAIVRLSITDPDTPITSLQLTWNTSNTNIVRNVQFGLAGGSNVVATVLLVRDAIGEAVVTVLADDGKTKVGRGFLLTVFEPPNEAPVFGPIADQTTTANSPAIVSLNITDPDTALSSLVFTATASNAGLVSGVTVDASTGTAIATVSLVADKTGISTVTITADDGKNKVSQTFALLVEEGQQPVVSAPTLSVVEGQVTVSVTWTGGGELEYSDSPIGPWVGTGNTSGRYSEPATGTAKFYRVNR